jgi:hypothetical protein
MTAPSVSPTPNTVVPAHNFVIPAHAGTQGFSAVSPATLGPRFRGDDEEGSGVADTVARP